MTATRRVPLRLKQLRFFLICLACCLLGAIAVARRGISCATEYTGIGSLVNVEGFDGTCADGSDCTIIECDATSCGGGLNCGEICWHGVQTQCGACD